MNQKYATSRMTAPHSWSLELVQFDDVILEDLSRPFMRNEHSFFFCTTKTPVQNPLSFLSLPPKKAKTLATFSLLRTVILCLFNAQRNHLIFLISSPNRIANFFPFPESLESSVTAENLQHCSWKIRETVFFFFFFFKKMRTFGLFLGFLRLC